MKIYFARHGQSEANLLQQISNRGWSHPLTGLGRAQAAGLAGRLAGAGITAIYTSPLRRAVETAEIAGQRLGLPVQVSPALCEYDMGELEGRADAQAWEGYAWLQAQWFDHARWDCRIPGGESYNDLLARFPPFIAGLLQPPAGEAALLVSHGGLYQAMLPHIIHGLSRAALIAHGFKNAACLPAEDGPNGLQALGWIE